MIADLGAVRPFTSIQKAEENHIAALMRLFDAYGPDAPANEWPGTVPAFDTLAEACEVGVQVEILHRAAPNLEFIRNRRCHPASQPPHRD